MNPEQQLMRGDTTRLSITNYNVQVMLGSPSTQYGTNVAAAAVNGKAVRRFRKCPFHVPKARRRAGRCGTHARQTMLQEASSPCPLQGKGNGKVVCSVLFVHATMLKVPTGGKFEEGSRREEAGGGVRECLPECPTGRSGRGAWKPAACHACNAATPGTGTTVIEERE